ncbi:hypothetical protein BDW67DRAFT_154070 [Aspergillus spinulosporus]
MLVLCLLLAAMQVAIFAAWTTTSRPFDQSLSGFLTLNFPCSCDAACQTAYIQGLAHDATLKALKGAPLWIADSIRQSKRPQRWGLVMPHNK